MLVHSKSQSNLKTTNASYVVLQYESLKYNSRNIFYQISYLKSYISLNSFQLMQKK